MQRTLIHVALCFAASLTLPTAHAGDDDSDPSPRLCDFTNAPESMSDAAEPPQQINAADYCPADEKCYVGAYPSDIHRVTGGYCTVDQLRGDLKYVIFLAEDAPRSVLHCESISACETACASYPQGEGIEHVWSVSFASPGYSSDRQSLRFVADSNTIVITHDRPDPVNIRVTVKAPFGSVDSSYEIRSPHPSCSDKSRDQGMAFDG